MKLRGLRTLVLGASAALALAAICGPALAEPFAGETLVARTYAKETPEYCAQQYKECLAKCEATPENRQNQTSMTQCKAYCQSVHSGCGK